MSTCERHFAAMGTEIRLIAVTPGGRATESALTAAERWLGLVEEILSRFLPESELSRVNQLAGRPCWVSPLLAECLDAALGLAAETGGLYDPTILPALQAAGYTATLPAVLAGAAPAPPSPPVNWRPRWRDVRLDRRMQTVALPAGAALDLGGMAKGWAADRIAERWRLPVPLVADIGGDLRISLPTGSDLRWPVSVESPFDPSQELARLSLPACGVATSNVLGRRWQTPNGPRHHVIDPRTGRPAESDLVQATVIAPTAAQAEAWAKALCVLGSKAGADFLATRSAAALMVRADGAVLATPTLEVYLHDQP